MAEEATPAPAAPAMSRSERISAAIKEAVALEPTQTEKAPAAPEKAEAPKEAAPEAKPKAEDKSFEKLLREKAALRPFMEASKGLQVDELKALAQAKAAKDPMAALKALGFKYEDVAEKAAGLPPEKKPEAPNENPDLAALKAEVAALKAERQQETTNKLRTEALGKAKEAVKGKFKHVEALEAEEKVLAYIESYWRQAGELPGDSFEDSIDIAAAAVEKELAKEAERWKKVLTPANPEPTVGAEGARNASAGQGTTGTTSARTLTNSSATAPARGVPTPKSRDELFKQILADPNSPWASQGE